MKCGKDGGKLKKYLKLPLILLILCLASCAFAVKKTGDAQNRDIYSEQTEDIKPENTDTEKTQAENKTSEKSPDTVTQDNPESTVENNIDENTANTDCQPENAAQQDEEKAENSAEVFPDIPPVTGTGYKKPMWTKTPVLVCDTLETFGKTEYSICGKNGIFTVVDMNGKSVSEKDFRSLIYCPEHGLSSADVTESIKLNDGITVNPDCGYRESSKDKNIYVYDDSRHRVYLTGFSDGEFRIIDITDTEFFKSNTVYTAALYNCDADLLMYDGIGMENLEDVFRAENTEMLFGVVTNDFRTVIDFEYTEISDGNDCYIVKKNGKYGYRGLLGQYYYDCIFDEANTAFKGVSWVKYGGKWGTVVF